VTESRFPIRVLQLITELRPAGAERIVYELAKGLPRERYEMEVCALRSATGKVADWLREADVPVHSLEMARKLDPFAPGRLVELLRERRIGLLHAHLYHANVLGRYAARKAGLRGVIGTIHIPEKRFRPWRFWHEKYSLGPHDVEVCVSEAVKRFMLERGGLPEAQLRVIPNGVDLSRFKEDVDRIAAARELRARLGLPTDALVVLAAGRLEAQKDYPLLLSAWERLIYRNEPRLSCAHLLIAGEGQERAKLEARIEKGALSSRVRLLGYRDDLPTLMAGADVFVQASAYEGFGLAVAEAMAAGLPVVATAVDSVPEVVGDEGAGVLVLPGDAGKLSEGLAEVLLKGADDRRHMGKLGRLRVEEHFTLQKMLAAYDALYQERLNANA